MHDRKQTFAEFGETLVLLDGSHAHQLHAKGATVVPSVAPRFLFDFRVVNCRRGANADTFLKGKNSFWPHVVYQSPKANGVFTLPVVRLKRFS
jgi:hypothetical protein